MLVPGAPRELVYQPIRTYSFHFLHITGTLLVFLSAIQMQRNFPFIALFTFNIGTFGGQMWSCAPRLTNPNM